MILIRFFAIMLSVAVKAKLKLLQFKEWGNNRFFWAEILFFGRRKMKKLYSVSIITAVVWFSLVFTSAPASAVVIHEQSTVSGIGTAVQLRAELAITGDILTVGLFNASAVSSKGPDDLLSSFFFDIIDGSGNRPSLTYLDAVGDVYLTKKNHTDLLRDADADLKADSRRDNTWQFKSFDPDVSPFLGFGIGTVGNSALSPNNFNGNIVGGMDYSIYAGDVTTRNLDGRLLVKSSITFTFAGLTGFTEADIAADTVFGLGTSPDMLVAAPEPATIALLCLGTVLLRKRK
ncbi:MAG: hypothetical protein A2173_08755 [Planctomycetes bacterium RBG_13_44_8b]|nr:MAG: hypothetical protein A2173_08755 [Planctomycetes bacterium RBG_13_44_8b]